MKGPSGRLKFDVRRLWQCPRCQHKELLPGRVVNRLCVKCQAQGEPQVWMALVEEKASKPGVEARDQEIST